MTSGEVMVRYENGPDEIARNPKGGRFGNSDDRRLVFAEQNFREGLRRLGTRHGDRVAHAPEYVLRYC